jgi:tetratricopeptide (TPR) repeat protein
MAKPMLVTTPAVLLLLDYWPLRRWSPWRPGVPEAEASDEDTSPRYARASLGWLLAEKLPLFALAVATIPLVVRAEGNFVQTLEQFPIAIRLQNVLVSYVRYLAMTFWPTNLAILYPHPRGRILMWQPIAAGLVLAALTLGALGSSRRRPYLLVGWLWYLGTLVPVIGFVQIGLQAVADRYTYVPLIGVFLALVWGLADLVRGRLAPLAVGAVAGGVLAACAVQSWLQLGYWRNSITLWQHALEVAEDNYVARDALGLALAAQGRLDEGRQQLLRSLELNPHSAPTHGNLALVLERQGQLEEAAQQFQESLRIKPDSALAHTGLGRVREHQGQPDAARQEYVLALATDPTYVEAHVRLGELLDRQGQLGEALAHYQAAVVLQPQDAAAHDRLGMALERLGRLDEALTQYEQALQLDPNYAAAYNNRGVALEKRGQWTEAAASYQQAVDLQPGQGLFRCNLAYALAEAGQSAAARAQYIEAFRLAPSWLHDALAQAWTQATSLQTQQRNGPAALRAAKQACQATGYAQAQPLDTLAAAYAELGQFDEAVVWARKALAVVPADQGASSAPAIAERLRLYEQHRPYRQPAPAPRAPATGQRDGGEK